MINPIYFTELGHANFGWLNARHHFSFGSYQNPNRRGFGKLRVVNDDVISAGTGFEMHPHENMEIITFVRGGAITHKDDQGNQGKTTAGNIQVMTAGTGIRHSEHNHGTTSTTLYQIWIEPNKKNITPHWENRAFPTDAKTDQLELLVSGTDSSAMHIHADADIYAGKLLAGQSVTQKVDKLGYLLVSQGQLSIAGVTLNKGDAAEITDEIEVTIEATTDAEVLLIDVAP
ncbi:pirin family protein [Arenicella sp. 4NH20-0111]|uniref:pirin family protein n=1 Tax=Arenicella sp. 4NH20-0111 TaxID=3127648 RepID=UPI003107A4D5